MAQHRGEEFRDEVRKRLPSAVLRPLTRLRPARATLALLHTFAALVVILVPAAAFWTPWVVLPAIVLIGTFQHALFILAHETAHYRLYESRALNDVVGRAVGMVSGISMCTYRVIHRLQHNHLYGPQDPDVALHGGYPRGRAYLLKKLLKDLSGMNAWKSYAYFFGSPAINADTRTAQRPLDDTSPKLRAQARQDRWLVMAWQLAALLLAYANGFLVQYLVLWILPAFTVLQVVLRLRAICEHGAVSDTTTPLKSARTNEASWIACALLFPHHVNYHLEHHLYPAVPHYNLPRLHAVLVEHGILADAEIRPLRETLRRIFGPPTRQVT